MHDRRGVAKAGSWRRRLALLVLIVAALVSTAASAVEEELRSAGSWEHPEYGLISHPRDCSDPGPIPSEEEIRAAIAAGDATVLRVDKEPVSEQRADLTWLTENRMPTEQESGELVGDIADQLAPAEDLRPVTYCFEVTGWERGRYSPSTEVPTSTVPALVLFSGDAHPDYQCDRIRLSDHGDYRAVEHQVYLPTPESNEYNQCDNTSSSSGCFWFAAIELNTGMAGDTHVTCGGHIGPIRGHIHVGWDVNYGLYCPNGPQSLKWTGYVPQNKWITVKTWRSEIVNYNGLILSKWNVQVGWDGWLNTIGSAWYWGDAAVTSGQFVELWEPGNPCSTDLRNVAFTLARYWPHPSGNPQYFDKGTADYQDTCNNTYWDSQVYYVTVTTDRRDHAWPARANASPHPVLWDF